jgi:tetratricopeptide (TPR) repeat protein
MQLNNKEYKESIGTFSKALQVQPLYVRSKAYRAISYLHLGDYQRAITDYAELDAQHRSDPKVSFDWECANFNTGWAFAHLSQYDDAVAFFEKVDTETQLGPDANIWLAELKNTMALPINNERLKELPDFCDWALKSNVQIKGKRQDEPIQ